jgi:hypothetical protein
MPWAAASGSDSSQSVFDDPLSATNIMYKVPQAPPGLAVYEQTVQRICYLLNCAYRLDQGTTKA